MKTKTYLDDLEVGCESIPAMHAHPPGFLHLRLQEVPLPEKDVPQRM